MINFLLGMLFILVCLPVIENLNTLLANRVQLSSYRTTKKIYEIKKQLSEIGVMEQQEQHKNPFGFQAPDCVGYEIDNGEEYAGEDEDI